MLQVLMLTLPSCRVSTGTGRLCCQKLTGDTGLRCNWTANARSQANGVVLSTRPVSERSRVTARCALRRVLTLIIGAVAI